jgi:uncharacterized protein DUF3606
MQPDPSRIDLDGLISIAQYQEIREWCAHLGCTEVELAEAIATVGYAPDRVRAFLADKSAQGGA